MKFSKVTSILFTFFLLASNCFSQTIKDENSNTENIIPLTDTYELLTDKQWIFDKSNNNTIFFDINSCAFTRNAEYFLPYTKGFTAIGFFLDPTISYQINDKSKISAGVHLLGIAGNDGLKRITPIFKIEYEPLKWLRIIGGTINGTVNHRFPEPLFDFDRYFYENDENGLEILTNTRYWNADIWCDWEDFIVPGDDKQEKFTFGWRNEFTLTEKDKTTEFSIPLHLMASHRGGQFTSLQDTCIETLINGMIGLNLAINSKDKFIKKTSFNIGLFGFKNNSNEYHIHTFYKDGWGIYPNITLQNKNWKLMTGYWYAEQFIASRGAYLFQSRSYFDETFFQKERNMITAKLFHEHNYKGLGFGADVQLYHDLDHEKTDFAFGIYLRFQNSFKIVKIKEN